MRQRFCPFSAIVEINSGRGLNLKEKCHFREDCWWDTWVILWLLGVWKFLFYSVDGWLYCFMVGGIVLGFYESGFSLVRMSNKIKPVAL